MEDLISVIVPIYNVEKYIHECLSSVLNQTYKNLEIILIDDGSQDMSGKICDEYGFKDNRIIVIHKKNGGLSAARNLGLKKSNGKYVVFIDSDDYLSENYVYLLYMSIKNNNSDIAICSYKFIKQNKNETRLSTLINNVSYSNVDILKNLLKGNIECYAWNKIYKKKLFDLNNITFPENKFYEDITTFVRLIIKSNRISYVDVPLYMYRIRKGSITDSKNRELSNDFNEAIYSVNEIIEYNNLKNEVSQELVNFNLMYTLMNLNIVSKYTHYSSFEFYSEFKKNFKEQYFKYKFKDIISNKCVLKWVKRDFVLFRLGLLSLKNRLRDNLE